MAYLGEEIKKTWFWPYETSAEIRRCDRCGADQSHGGQIYGSRIYIF